MMTPRILPCLLPLLAIAGLTPVRAQNADAKRIYGRIEELRPTDDVLGMYRLDWAPSLPEALARAKAEKRPVFLVIIHAQYGDLYSGHC